MHRKDSGLDHFKRMWFLVRACVPHASLEWCKNKLIEVGKIQNLKIELKKEETWQNNYSRSGIVVHGVEYEYEK